MRLAYIIPWSGYGGSEQQFVNTIQKAQDFGHDVFVATGDQGPLFPQYKNHADKLVVGQFSDDGFDIPLTSHVFDAIDSFDPDLIHIQRPGGEPLPMYAGTYIGQVPIALTTLCDRDEGDVTWTDLHVIPSEYSQSLQSKPHPNRHVIPHSVQYKNPDNPSSSIRSIVTSCQNIYDIVLGRVGTISPTKKIQDAIEAVRGYDDICLIIGGRDKFGYTNSLHFPENVYYVGKVSEEDKWWLLHNIDACLYPTTKEAQGLAMIEAMMAGNLVLTYDDSANRETVGDHGLYIPKYDRASTLHAEVGLLRQILPSKNTDSERFKRQVSVIERYSPSLQFARLQHQYKDIVYD